MPKWQSWAWDAGSECPVWGSRPPAPSLLLSTRPRPGRGAATISLEGQSPALSLEWPPMGGGPAAGGLEPWLFTQLSELAPAPPLGPSLSGVKTHSSVPTPGSDLLEAGFVCGRRKGQATKWRAAGQPLGQSPVETVGPWEAAPSERTSPAPVFRVGKGPWVLEAESTPQFGSFEEECFIKGYGQAQAA